MLIGITGTPGAGKTIVSEKLRAQGIIVEDINKISKDNGFLIGKDKKRNTNILDIEQLDKYIKKNYTSSDVIIFFEGHAAHLLKSLHKIIILRCHPKELKKRLTNKKWKPDKIKENLEAEILDIILCEAQEYHKDTDLFEIDTTHTSIQKVHNMIIEINTNDFQPMKKYNIGQLDWSEEIFKEYIVRI